jgi:hypothetical protein
MAAALREVLTPRLAALGFGGGAFRLDAGRVPPRAALREKTPRQDYATYTSTVHTPYVRRSLLPRVAKHRTGADWFFFDTGTSPRYMRSVAASAAGIVETEGARFWRYRPRA